MSKRTRLPKYRRHSSGQAFVEIDGRRHYLGFYGSDESKERYQCIIAELCSRPKADILAARSPADRVNGITIVELIAVYLEFARDYYRKNGRPTGTAERLRPVMRRLRGLYGLSPAIEFGPIELKALRQSMVDAGHSRTYVNMNVDRVRRMFRWAVAESLIPATVHQALAAVPNLRKGRTEARESAPVTPVSDEVVEATLPYLTPAVADMVRLQRLTGCRPNEVRLIRPRDVDRSGGDVWLYRPAEHKTEHHERDRVIVIGPKAQDILRPYLLRSPDSYCSSPAESRQKWLASRHAARQTPLNQGNRPGRNQKRMAQRAPGKCYRRLLG
jgi:integrase